jgi:hypothetical protein
MLSHTPFNTTKKGTHITYHNDVPPNLKYYPSIYKLPIVRIAHANSTGITLLTSTIFFHNRHVDIEVSEISYVLKGNIYRGGFLLTPFYCK